MEGKANIEKVKNVVIVILSIAIMVLIGYLIIIGTAYFVLKDLIGVMYSLNDKSELLVYTTSITDEQGEKIKVPVINLNYKEVNTVNEEIKQKILEVGNDSEVQYIYAVENDLLTVVIKIKDYEQAEWLLYRIDTRTGKNVIDNIELFEKYYGIKIDQAKYEEELKQNSEATDADDINNPIIVLMRYNHVYTLIKDVNNGDKYINAIPIDLDNLVEGGMQ